eukprot:TRINITY_DN96400_c0_g1_i1.p1 TRINITY_DN96400_c0_g1~~TRINITY_DN96400_c0_g1_i1.p1  ORF type:complete len:234 (+),score=37.68 TRINITY_DN96400_c0_g1_i1:81-704(+)
MFQDQRHEDLEGPSRLTSLHRYALRAASNWRSNRVLVVSLGIVAVVVIAIAGRSSAFGPQSGSVDGVVSYVAANTNYHKTEEVLRKVEDLKHMLSAMQMKLEDVTQGEHFCGHAVCAEVSQCCGKKSCCTNETLCCHESGHCCGADSICCGTGCCHKDGVCCPNGLCGAPGSTCKDGIVLAAPLWKVDNETESNMMAQIRAAQEKYS